MSSSETVATGDVGGNEKMERSPSGKHIVAYQFRPNGVPNEGQDELGEAHPAVPRMPSLFGTHGALSNSKSSSKQDLHADSPTGSPPGLKSEPFQASQYKSKSMSSPQHSVRGHAGHPGDASQNDALSWNVDEHLRSSPRKAKRGGGGFCYRYGHQQKDRVRELLSRARELERPAIQQVWEPSPTGEVPPPGSPRPQLKPRTPRSPVREESPRRPSQVIRREQELYRLALRIAANNRAKQLPPEASLRAGLSSSSSQRHHRAQEHLLKWFQRSEPSPMSAPTTASTVKPARYEDPGFDPMPRLESQVQYMDSAIMAQSPAPDSSSSRPSSRQSPFFTHPLSGGQPQSSGRFVVNEIVSGHEVEDSLKSWQKLRLKPIKDQSQVYESHLNHFFPAAPRASARDPVVYVPYGQREKKTPRWR